MMEKNLMALMKQIPKIKSGNRFILGLDGLSRSGKTTLGDRLSEHLTEAGMPFHLFHIDDHIVEREKRYATGHDQWYEYYHLQWDIDWLSRNFFEQLKGLNQVSLPFYDNESDTHSIQDIDLPDACLIIIEGVFLQRREWRSFFDMVVYVDCSRETRYLRESDAAKRHMDKLRNRYWKAEEFYLRTEKPMGKADLVIEG
ncbi:kinase [Paenisporosarcina indica]|uniref:kinase n=1 Tax=Paenisporosarcina indica TaxID=650093 RepID=UPI003CCC2F73